MNKLSPYAPVVLRLGLAAVFIWFGLSQILDQKMWISLIPSWATSLSGMSATTLVLVNGIFEVCAAALLALGLFVRTVSLLLFLHLLSIVGDVGLNAIGIRDIGLTLAMLSVFLHGADFLSLSHREEVSAL